MHRYSKHLKPRGFPDRFIPRRDVTDFECSYHIIDYEEESSSLSQNSSVTIDEDAVFLNTAKNKYNAQKYRNELREVLFPSQNRVLQFSTPRKLKKYFDESTDVWPVEARSKPLLGAPSTVLDMPDLDTHLCHQVVDWGKKGYIAATYDGEVHLWHPEQKVSRRVTNTGRKVKNCIKWNKEGTHFAMALRNREIAIWDFESFKTTAQAVCRCSLNCTITAIEWAANNFLITGCSNGCVCYWSSNLTCIKTCPSAHCKDIISIKLSCKERGMVSTGIDKQVKTWIWPDFLPNADMEYNGPTKAVDWHPWRDSLLAVGGPIYSTIWNVNTGKIISFREHPHSNSSVDCLSFNPVSAELVVTYWSLKENGGSENYISVLKNLDSVVDEIRYNNGRVPYLLWDCTGTKLATASSDENLCIWDFFGTSSKLEKKYLKTKKKTFTMNMFSNLYAFGDSIR
nr:protein cortex-like isoform X1 [Leptinotarsa decemlineata]XP_023013365.1 protein cortex-like isoform X2 [Leptinotarsa decemlineata]